MTRRRAIDALRLPAIALWWASALTGCVQELTAPRDDTEGVRYPAAITAHPSGRYVYVAGANFDRRYAGGVFRAIDTSTMQYAPDARVEVPTYASDIELYKDATGAMRAFVTAREDDTISVIDVDPDGQAPTMDCGQATGEGAQPCADSRRFGGLKGADALGEDPLSLDVALGTARGDLLHVVAARTGQLSVFDLDEMGPDGTAAPRLTTDLFGFGASGVLTSPLTGRSYVAYASTNALRSYTIEAEELEDDGAASRVDEPADEAALEVRRRSTILLPSGGGGDYTRGMALSRDAGRLYAAYRNPASLLIVDIAPGDDGTPRDTLVDVVGLGGRPAAVRVAPTGPDGAERVYVSCFGSDDVWVVDPKLRSVVDVIALPHAPYAVEVAEVPGRGWTLFVGLFTQHQVLVVPLEADAPDRHTVTETLP